MKSVVQELNLLRQEPKIIDTEVFDDNDFYHHLLKEFIELKYSNNPTAIAEWASSVAMGAAVVILDRVELTRHSPGKIPYHFSVQYNFLLVEY